MNGPYSPPMAQLGHFYPVGYPAMILPDHLPPGYHQPPLLTMDNMGPFAGYDEMPRPPGEPVRNRRRSAPGSENVKHRRTRSGCYTCRQRRVKCDETHPICERCRKGKRECTYPGTASSSSSKTAAKDKLSPGGASATDSDAEGDDAHPTSTLSDVEEDDVDGDNDSSTLISPATDSIDTSPPAASFDSPSPRTLPTASRAKQAKKPFKPSEKEGQSVSDQWMALPDEIRMYLNYAKEHLTHHHYGMKYDGSNFLKSSLLDIAVADSSGALLYAIVSFAAYHQSHASNEGKIYTFLTYYNHSITCLQQSLKNKRHTVETLLAILQLATIEEFLGDWVNLLGHHRAAHRILTDLYTPQTIMNDETTRKIITWYNRFALFASLMSGGQTKLSREWVAAAADYYQAQSQERPHDLTAKFEDFFTRSRLLATEVTLVLSARVKGEITNEQLFSQVAVLRNTFDAFGEQLRTTFIDPACFAKSFPMAPAPNDDEINDFRDPNFLYIGEYAPMNFVLMDFWGADLTFRFQVSLVMRQPPPIELVGIALKKAKMFDAIRYGDQRSAYSLLGCQASLAMLTLFLPKDPKHNMWARKSFALIEERYGYMYPATIRRKMSDLWHEDVTRWWLPNDEGYPRNLRAIRDFTDYRATQPIDKQGQDVRDMSGIFQKNLNLAE